MGIIIRQSIKNSAANFAGIAISGISTLFIYPLYSELYGLAQFLISTATLLIPFASLGTLSSLTKFFPTFRTTDNSNNGFLPLTLLALFSIFSIFSLFYFGFSDAIINWFNGSGSNKVAMTFDLLIVLYLLCLLTALNSILGNYSANYQRIVIPQLITQFLLRIFLPILVICSFYYKLSYVQFGYCLLLFTAVQVFLQYVYINKLGVLNIKAPNWKFITQSLKKKILNYQFFATFNQLGYALAFRIDLFMIPLFLDLSNNGIYAIALFISNIIELPARAVISIADPIISDAWSKNNLKEINTIYKKSTLNLLIPGLAIFCFLWFGFDAIAGISSNPEKFFLGKYALLFLGLGKLLDLITSLNNQLIVYSPKYKYNLLFILAMAIINIALNLYLIPIYGITGAAVASFISYFAYNLAKMIFIYHSYKLQPFTKEVFWVLVLGIIAAFLLYALPAMPHPLLQLFLNGIILILYFLSIYFLKLSIDFNNVVDSVLLKIQSVISKN